MMEVGAPCLANMHQAVAVAHAGRFARHCMFRESACLLRRQADHAPALDRVGQRPEKRQHVVGGRCHASRTERHIDPWRGRQGNAAGIGGNLVGRLVTLGIENPVRIDDRAARPCHAEGCENPLAEQLREWLPADVLGEFAEDFVSGVRIMPVRARGVSSPKSPFRKHRRVAREAGDMVEQVLQLNALPVGKGTSGNRSLNRSVSLNRPSAAN